MEQETLTRANDASDPGGVAPPPGQKSLRSFRIYRYDPENGAAPSMQTIEVELEGSDRMLLDALMKLKAKDPSLSFRRS
jgi:hypothetical protein